MDVQVTLQKLAIALGLGLLVGLQRERARARVAGIRTFALITVLGAVTALLAERFGGWVVAAGFVALAILLVIGNVASQPKEDSDAGLTTEMAVLLMYGVGAYVIHGHHAVAVIVGGGAALLLHFKAPMHAFVATIGEKDVTATMRFVLIALVILPALPDQAFGPYAVLNPYDIWFMVVLIVGINLAGYVCFKLLTRQAGVVLAGLLGGMVSSTATTVSFARQSRQGAASAPLAALVIFIASTVAYVRMIAEIAIAAPGAFWQLAPPLCGMLGWAALVATLLYFWQRRVPVAMSEPANPAELLPALVFAALYALVLLGIAYAQDFFGDAGLFVVAFFSGLHDVDAITLSTAGYVEQGQVAASLGWRVVLWASLVNVVVKGIIAWTIAGGPLGRALLWPFAAILAGGGALLFWWP